VIILRRSFLILLLVCLGCSAQSVPSETAKAIDRQIRSSYHLPASVQIELGALTPSEFPNFDGLKIGFGEGSNKKDYDFLLSKDRKTLLRVTKLDLTKNPNQDVMGKIDLKGRPTRGNKDAKVVIVNFDDFQCPFCSRMHQTLFPQIYKEYGDRVLFVYKDFPLTEIHPWAIHAAVNANCLAQQNNDAYWDFADYIHANQRQVNGEHGQDAQVAELDKITLLQGQQHNLDAARLQACIKAQKDDSIQASMKEGESVGVSATPVLFINGEEVEGALPIDQLRTVLDRALTEAGVPVPTHPAATASATPGLAAK
jgi:protein-disulfide isomerase